MAPGVAVVRPPDQHRPAGDRVRRVRTQRPSELGQRTGLRLEESQDGRLCREVIPTHIATRTGLRRAGREFVPEGSSSSPRNETRNDSSADGWGRTSRFSLLETLRRSSTYSALVRGFGASGRTCELDVSVSGRTCVSFTSTGVAGRYSRKSQRGSYGACPTICSPVKEPVFGNPGSGSPLRSTPVALKVPCRRPS